MPSTQGRNDPCACGSGRKYKQCCQGKASLAPSSTSRIALITVGVVVLLGLVIMGASLFRGGANANCPPGTAWSTAHQHCH